MIKWVPHANRCTLCENHCVFFAPTVACFFRSNFRDPLCQRHSVSSQPSRSSRQPSHIFRTNCCALCINRRVFSLSIFSYPSHQPLRFFAAVGKGLGVKGSSHCSEGSRVKGCGCWCEGSRVKGSCCWCETKRSLNLEILQLMFFQHPHKKPRHSKTKPYPHQPNTVTFLF